MKKLLMTTAIVAATSFGAFAQTAPAADTTATTPAMTATADRTMGANVPAFLASNFTGQTLYTLDSDAARNLRSQDGVTRWNTGDTFVSERDRWESVGSISDIVMTQDGSIRGILIDVGGFLGFFARTVMIDIEELYFVADDATAEDLNDYFVVASLTREQLEALPEWNADTLRTGYEARHYSMGMDQHRSTDGMAATTTTGGMAATTTTGGMATTDRAAQPAATVNPGQNVAATEGRAAAPAAPSPAPEGYAMVEGALPTAEQLLGATVYDSAGDSVGNVNDLTLNADAEVVEVLVDVGGFLGIGSRTVALPLENVDVLWNASNDSVRVHLPMNRDMIESLPEHRR